MSVWWDRMSTRGSGTWCCLLTAYYILKVIREPLILQGGGAVKRSYPRGMQAGLLFLAIPAYSALANRVEPARLVKWILGAPIGFAFFVWLLVALGFYQRPFQDEKDEWAAR